MRSANHNRGVTGKQALTQSQGGFYHVTTYPKSKESTLYNIQVSLLMQINENFSPFKGLVHF